LDRFTYRAIRVTNQKALSEEIVGFLSHVKIGNRGMGEVKRRGGGRREGL